MDVVHLMTLLGGVAPWGVLVRVTSRPEVESARDAGLITRIGRGRYALPVATDALVLAARASGIVCLTAAAIAHGWAVKTVPDKPQVAVPKHRRLADDVAGAITPYWIDLGPFDAEGYCTTEAKTLEMCLRRLPFDEALCIADSALRDGFPVAGLRELVREAKGPGSAQMRAVAEHARSQAANPFESTLRAIALTVDGLDVEPQVGVQGALGLKARPDLVDERLRLVLEADSFEWHGNRAALRKDARRYDLMVVNGWTVLRFSWEDVMHDATWVRAVLVEAVRSAERTDPCPSCGDHT